jgi:acyl-CoA thioester hydrolase
MYHFEQKLRVRYAETDQMGYVYYGNYSTYYEVARVESIRALGLTYREIEEAGVIMPVLENNSKYIRPAYDYDIFKGEVLIHRGFTSLVFVEKSSGKPCQMPNLLGDLLKPFFDEV